MNKRAISHILKKTAAMALVPTMTLATVTGDPWSVTRNNVSTYHNHGCFASQALADASPAFDPTTRGLLRLPFLATARVLGIKGFRDAPLSPQMIQERRQDLEPLYVLAGHRVATHGTTVKLLGGNTPWRSIYTKDPYFHEEEDRTPIRRSAGAVLFPAIGPVLQPSFFRLGDHLIFNDQNFKIHDAQVDYPGQSNILISFLIKHAQFDHARLRVFEHKQKGSLEWITYEIRPLHEAVSGEKKVKKLTFLAGDIMSMELPDLGLPSLGMVYSTNMGWRGALGNNVTFWLKMREMLGPHGVVYAEDQRPLLISAHDPLLPQAFRPISGSNHLFEVNTPLTLTPRVDYASHVEGGILAYLRTSEALNKILQQELPLDSISLCYLLTDANLDLLARRFAKSQSARDETRIFAFLTSLAGAQENAAQQNETTPEERRVLHALLPIERQLLDNMAPSRWRWLSTIFSEIIQWIAPAALSTLPAESVSFAKSLRFVRQSFNAARRPAMLASFISESILTTVAFEFADRHGPQVIKYVNGKLDWYLWDSDHERLDIARGGQLLFQVFQAVYYGFPGWLGNYILAVIITSLVRLFHNTTIFFTGKGVMWTAFEKQPAQESNPATQELPRYGTKYMVEPYGTVEILNFRPFGASGIEVQVQPVDKRVDTRGEIWLDLATFKFTPHVADVALEATSELLGGPDLAVLEAPRNVRPDYTRIDVTPDFIRELKEGLKSETIAWRNEIVRAKKPSVRYQILLKNLKFKRGARDPLVIVLQSDNQQIAEALLSMDLDSLQLLRQMMYTGKREAFDEARMLLLVGGQVPSTHRQYIMVPTYLLPSPEPEHFAAEKQSNTPSNGTMASSAEQQALERFNKLSAEDLAKLSGHEPGRIVRAFRTIKSESGDLPDFMELAASLDEEGLSGNEAREALGILNSMPSDTIPAMASPQPIASNGQSNPPPIEIVGENLTYWNRLGQEQLNKLLKAGGLTVELRESLEPLMGESFKSPDAFLEAVREISEGDPEQAKRRTAEIVQALEKGRRAIETKSTNGNHSNGSLGSINIKGFPELSIAKVWDHSDAWHGAYQFFDAYHQTLGVTWRFISKAGRVLQDISRFPGAFHFKDLGPFEPSNGHNLRNQPSEDISKQRLASTVPEEVSMSEMLKVWREMTGPGYRIYSEKTRDSQDLLWRIEEGGELRAQLHSSEPSSHFLRISDLLLPEAKSRNYLERKYRKFLDALIIEVLSKHPEISSTQIVAPPDTRGWLKIWSLNGFIGDSSLKPVRSGDVISITGRMNWDWIQMLPTSSPEESAQPAGIIHNSLAGRIFDLGDWLNWTWLKDIARTWIAPRIERHYWEPVLQAAELLLTTKYRNIFSVPIISNLEENFDAFFAQFWEELILRLDSYEITYVRAHDDEYLIHDSFEPLTNELKKGIEMVFIEIIGYHTVRSFVRIALNGTGDLKSIIPLAYKIAMEVNVIIHSDYNQTIIDRFRGTAQALEIGA
jgi:hypothetical protein